MTAFRNSFDPSRLLCLLMCLALVFLWSTAALCQEQPESQAGTLAKEAQNPVANMISVPIQNNLNFNYGPLHRAQNVTNIQPVIPISLGDDWNLITRTIAPLIYMPQLTNGRSGHNGIGDVYGLGDITLTAFLSPVKNDGFIWGVGPVFALPTATDPKLLGTEKWGLGPSLVGLYVGKKIVAGALVNNVWSVAGDPNRKDVSLMTLQPFFNYNFTDGWYLCSSPIITANWLASKSNDIWTVPLGGGVGKLFHAGKLPVNAQLQAYYNVARPKESSDWSVRLQLQFLFPK